jgi:formamidopyrimidine-DNA glycosylase
MPELPEVETVRRVLIAGGIVGARIDAVWTSGKRLRLGRPVQTRRLRALVTGRRIIGAGRRGKYLLFALDGGGAIVVHLGMSGRLLLARGVAPRPAHTHVAFCLERGRELRFVDPRRFGLVAPVRDARDEARIIGAMGKDPLTELSPEDLGRLLRGRRSVKTFLLDQRAVAGLGNIYVSEALHLAGIHPLTPAGRVRGERATALHRAIVDVLKRALRKGGTTLRDFVDGDGVEGRNQEFLMVYGREGEACLRDDGGTVQRVIIQGRSTYFCPRCQRLAT